MEPPGPAEPAALARSPAAQRCEAVPREPPARTEPRAVPAATGCQVSVGGLAIPRPQREQIKPPAVTAIAPKSGPAAGRHTRDDHRQELHRGHGSRLRHGPAINFKVVSSSEITATDPAGTPYTTTAGKAGYVDVTVVTPGGTSALATADISRISPPRRSRG